VPPPPLAGAERVSLLVPAVGLALVTLAIGVSAESVFQLSLRAAEQLLDGREYIAAVLGVAR
jgi:multicomponent Na+:H+ antiporter subunit D